MGRRLNYDAARQILESEFQTVVADEVEEFPADVKAALKPAIDTLFASNTQAFREVLVGCCLARIVDPHIDIRFPYMNQGDSSYNGRTLDEKVVNTFLKEQEIPSSKSPFLSSFRRNVSFLPETGKGLRDKVAFAAFLLIVDELRTKSAEYAALVLRGLLRAFIELRDKAQIKLARINRLSVDQHKLLTLELRKIKSGGLIPVILSVAAFRTLSATYGLNWNVEFQGINVADAASGAGGDITISREGVVLIAVEVTEREIDKARVRSTFMSKIAPNALSDYLFIHSATAPSIEAKAAAMAYFAQGHDINFISIGDWITSLLTIIGMAGRQDFTVQVIALLSQPDVPTKLRVAWNAVIPKVVSV